METDKIKTKTVITAIAAIITIEIVARIFIRLSILGPLGGLGMARLAEIILLLIIVKAQHQQISTIGLAASGLFRGLQKGLIWALSFGAVAGIGLLGIYLAGINVSGLFQMQLPSESDQFIIFLLVGVLIGPIAEEIFFRGILYSFFRKWGIPMAVMISTLLFVLSHAQTSGSILPVTQIIGGILFAISYEVEKNLLVPITIHCLGNLAIFTLALLF